MDDVREDLAALAHEQWTGWMEYVFGHCVLFGDDWMMDGALAARWQRQMRTPYADLSEQEKDSDRKEADRVLALLSRHRRQPQGGRVEDS